MCVCVLLITELAFIIQHCRVHSLILCSNGKLSKMIILIDSGVIIISVQSASRSVHIISKSILKHPWIYVLVNHSSCYFINSYVVVVVVLFIYFLFFELVLSVSMNIFSLPDIIDNFFSSVVH